MQTYIPQFHLTVLALSSCLKSETVSSTCRRREIALLGSRLMKSILISVNASFRDALLYHMNAQPFKCKYLHKYLRVTSRQMAREDQAHPSPCGILATVDAPVFMVEKGETDRSLHHRYVSQWYLCLFHGSAGTSYPKLPPRLFVVLEV